MLALCFEMYICTLLFFNTIATNYIDYLNAIFAMEILFAYTSMQDVTDEASTSL